MHIIVSNGTSIVKIERSKVDLKQGNTKDSKILEETQLGLTGSHEVKFLCRTVNT